MQMVNVATELPVGVYNGHGFVGVNDDLNITFRLVDSEGVNHFVEMSTGQAQEVIRALSTLVNINMSLQTAMAQSQAASMTAAMENVMKNVPALSQPDKDQDSDKPKIGFQP